MGPLQYLVVGYDRNDFKTNVLPELETLSKRRIIRVIDVVFISRNTTGDVESQELVEVMPDQGSLLASRQENIFESFTQDDIDVAGDALPAGTSVALLLFEHCWADRLEEAVHKASSFIDCNGSRPGDLALALEYRLARGRPVSREEELWAA